MELEDLKKALKEKQDKNLELCSKEIEQILIKYECTITTNAECIINGQKIAPIIKSL